MKTTIRLKFLALHYNPTMPRKSTWVVYILRCKGGTLYTGITNNLQRRLQTHNAGRASRYTRAHRPVKLVYQERAASRSAALRREYEIKQWPRDKKAVLIGKIR